VKYDNLRLRLQRDENKMWNGLEKYGGGNLFGGIGQIFSGVGSGIGSITKSLFHGAEGLIKQGGDEVNKITKTVFHGVKEL